MTSKNYEYLGTLITKQSFDTVTQGQLPKLQARDVSKCKTTREEKCMKSLHQVSNGKHAKQFPLERVADGIAMCERRWEHFSNSKGALAPSLQLLPHELATELLRLTLMTGMHDVHAVPEVHAEQQEAARFMTLLVDAPPPALQKHQHAGEQFYEFKQGDRTEKGYLNTRAPTDAEFRARKVYPGCFVITRPAVSSHWAKTSPKLRSLDFWLWEVVKVYPPGSSLPGTAKKLESWT